MQNHQFAGFTISLACKPSGSYTNILQQFPLPHIYRVAVHSKKSTQADNSLSRLNCIHASETLNHFFNIKLSLRISTANISSSTISMLAEPRGSAFSDFDDLGESEVIPPDESPDQLTGRTTPRAVLIRFASVIRLVSAS